MRNSAVREREKELFSCLNMDRDTVLADALIRVEGVSSCPGQGWERIRNAETVWIREISGASSTFKDSVVAALSDLKLRGDRVVLFLNLVDDPSSQPVLLDGELIQCLGSSGVEVEVWSG